MSQPPRAVLGEDQPFMREGIAAILRRAGIDVVEAVDNAVDLVRATEEHHPVHFHVAVYPRPYSSYVRGVLASAAADDAAEEAPVRARAAESSAPRATATHASTVRYEVERGDTLWHLARRYGTTVRKIQAANHLSTTRLKPGQEIVIPASGQ